MSTFKKFYYLSRPKDYIKNFFIFLPAFFTSNLFSAEISFNLLIAFISFSLISSSVYVINDWFDRHDDRKHPTKCNRPIASGSVKGFEALILFGILFLSSVLVASYLSTNIIYLILFYFFLNLSYSLKLKHIAILDVAIISFGFVIRLYVGSQTADVSLSHWIIVMTFLLALFLSFAKRRDDVLIFNKTNKKMRESISAYNLKFLDIVIAMTSSVVIIVYLLWSISIEVQSKLNFEGLYLSSFFVILGILRYLQLIFVYEMSGNPRKIFLKDLFTLLNVISWTLFLFWNLYL